MLLGIILTSFSWAGKIIVTNNVRVTYDFDYEIKPYIANEIKFTSDGTSSAFAANKFRLGFRYKINDYVRIDPHWFIDNKQKNDWAFEHGVGLRLDVTPK